MTRIISWIVVTLLRLLQFLHNRKGFNVEFVQDMCGDNTTLIFKNGIPADRDCWLYLPYLRNVSLMFQPPVASTGTGKVYRDLLPPGSVVSIASRGGKVIKKLVVTSSDIPTEELVNGVPVIKGPLAVA